MRFDVQVGDALDVASDVLVVKYAQSRYGVDARVSDVLVRHGLCDESEISPAPGAYGIVGTRGHIGPQYVLYVGTERLHRFGYNQMAQFAREALCALASEGISAPRISTTVHGANYGLDAGEALEYLAAGFAASVDGVVPASVSFVECDDKRATLLKTVLSKLSSIDAEPPPPQPESPSQSRQPQAPAVAATPVPKEHIFIAMPFSVAFEDVYNFGIYAPVREAGYVCEHVGEAAFTGDVLLRIRDRIASAKLMIADLTEARPNVYLEVGYAWGRGIPVVFVAQEGEDIHFDVSTHRCLYYRNVTHLAEKLGRFLTGL